MATRQLGPTVAITDGTSEDDRFRAKIITSDLGLQLNTLQTGDEVNGLGGRDHLIFDATTLLGDYIVAPTLNSVEDVTIRSSSGQDNDLVLNLSRSTGVRTVSSIGSDTNVEVRSAGSANQFFLLNFRGTDPLGGEPSEGLIVNGVERNVVRAEIRNSDDSLVSLDKQGALPFKAANVTVADSDITLDVGAERLKLTSTGAGDMNHLSLDGEFDKINIGGDVRLELEGENQQELEIGTSFTAAGNTAGVEVEARIFGELGTLIATDADDEFASIESESALTVNLGAGDDVALIVNAAGGLTANAGDGDDELEVQNLVATAADSILMGAGDDKLDVSGAPVDFDNVGTSDTLGGGDGQDELHITLNGLSAAEGSHITGFEDLTLAIGSFGAFDMAGLPDVTSVTMESFLSDFEFTNVANATSFVVENSDNFVSLDAAGAVDLESVSVVLGQDEDTEVSPAEPGTTLDFLDLEVSGFNTLTLDSRGGDLVDPLNDDANFVFFTAVDTEALVITGSEDLFVASFDNGLTSVSAGAATGDVDLTGIFYQGSVTITDGKGDDRLSGSEDADIFNLTNGGEDSVLFTSITESDGTDFDTINGFDSAGNDTLEFALLGIVDIRQGAPNVADGNNDTELAFLGNVATTVDANAAFAASLVANPEDVAMVYDQSTNSLLVDLDQSGSFVAGTLDVKIVINDANDALTLQDFELV